MDELVRFLKERLARFPSKKDFTITAGLSEGHLHQLLSGRPPGMLTAVRLGRALGVSPVRILRLGGQDEMADLLAAFIPEEATIPDAPTMALAKRVEQLAAHGFEERLHVLLQLLEGPWKAGKALFDDIIARARAEKGMLVKAHGGARRVILYGHGCGPDDLANCENWRVFEHHREGLELELRLYPRKVSLDEGLMAVYLRTWALLHEG